MTSRNKGQIRIGKSGATNVGGTAQESATKPKIGSFSPISVGQNINDLKREEEKLSDQRRENIERERERNEKKWLEILKEGERTKKEKDRDKKEKDRDKKEKDRDKKEKDRNKREKERNKKKKLSDEEESEIASDEEESEIASDEEESEIASDKDSSNVESQTIIKFANKIDGFNVLVQDNKISGRSWYRGLDGDWWQGMSEKEARTIVESGQDLENFQKIENSQDAVSEQEREGSQKEDVLIPESQIVTVSDMIDNMRSQCHRDLPKDVEKRISYIYPLDSTHSFHIVAVNHIKYLRYQHTIDNRYVEIEEIDWSQLSNIDWNEKRSILLHPFLYPFASIDSFMQNSRNFAKLLAMKNKIGGFDVADSDRISKPAADLINKIDLMMVPSNFVKDTYIKSGVTIPVEVLPHGISDKFLDSETVITDNDKIMKLRKMRQKGKILVLYFLVHSPHRKGADLVRRVIKRIQKKYKDVYLVVRSKKCDYFSNVRSICIDSWLSDNDLVALYDSCDICLSPSRGGGFELNALEAISRGIPTLVPNGGCFTDLMDYFIPVDVSDKITQPLPGNTIHTGFGCQVDMDDFEDKLSDVVNRLDYWKERSKSNSKEIREKYSWKNTAKMLDEHLRNHGFIE